MLIVIMGVQITMQPTSKALELSPFQKKSKVYMKQKYHHKYL